MSEVGGGKHLALLALAAGLLCSAASARLPKEKNREEMGLKGSVRSLRIEITKFAEQEGKWAEGPRVPLETYQFNTEGKVRSIEEYVGGDLVSRQAYTYDKHGNMATLDTYGPCPLAMRKESFALSRNGKIERWTWNDLRTPRKFVTGYKYDTDGRLVQVTSSRSDKDGEWESAYLYDGQGKLTAIEECAPDGDRYRGKVIEYDARGRETRQTVYKEDGSIVYDMEQEYDDDRVVKATVSEPGEPEMTWRYRYSGNGQRLEMLYYLRGVLLAKQTYNAEGQVAGIFNYSPSGKTELAYVHEYEYDGHGNWTRKTSLKKENEIAGIIEITYRILDYYEKAAAESGGRASEPGAPE